jgi:CsoR family transcriptional regulator, copper-sensing transcriptional repressor
MIRFGSIFVKIKMPSFERMTMHYEHKVSEKKITQLLKTARGQLEAILTMYESDRYCVDITKQILALQALLKKANNLILNDHMNGCVKEALNQKQTDAKLKELAEIMDLLQQ